MTARLIRWILVCALVVASVPAIAASEFCAERAHACCAPKPEKTCCAPKAELTPGCACEIRDALPAPAIPDVKVVPVTVADLPAALVILSSAPIPPVNAAIEGPVESLGGGDRAPPRSRGPPVR